MCPIFTEQKRFWLLLTKMGFQYVAGVYFLLLPNKYLWMGFYAWQMWAYHVPFSPTQRTKKIYKVIAFVKWKIYSLKDSHFALDRSLTVNFVQEIIRRLLQCCQYTYLDEFLNANIIHGDSNVLKRDFNFDVYKTTAKELVKH